MFSFFSFFNYLYGIASLWKPQIRRTQPSGKKIAVVIVAFNEGVVLPETIRACDALTYENKLTVLADDSTDPQVVEMLRHLAIARGCKKVERHPFYQETDGRTNEKKQEQIEIWESPSFVFFHRPSNVGFKGGSLKKVHQYLGHRGIDLMYLLDADWHPQKDALERTLEVLEADKKTAFVQTKRVSIQKGMNLFQKYAAIIEEGCYYVDFEGRQVLGHPTLFSGCCTLFRLNAVSEIGGFMPGHLTEDLDLTDRFWLSHWKGIYLGDVVNYGELPFTYDHYRRQQERWAAGSARALRDFFFPILKSKTLGWFEKLSAIRQNAYFTSTLFTGASVLLGVITLLWLTFARDSYATEYYLYFMGRFKVPFFFMIFWCVSSNLIEPLIMIVVKKRRYRDILHIPMMVWYAWSVIPTYIIGNVKGLLGLKLDWFRTPKFIRSGVGDLPSMPFSVRAINLSACAVILCFYFVESMTLGWFDLFALLWIPSFLLASIK